MLFRKLNRTKTAITLNYKTDGPGYRLRVCKKLCVTLQCKCVVMCNYVISVTLRCGATFMWTNCAQNGWRYLLPYIFFGTLCHECGSCIDWRNADANTFALFFEKNTKNKLQMTSCVMSFLNALFYELVFFQGFRNEFLSKN